MTTIIIITGTSSSGKTSTCETLKKKLGDNWIYFSTDAYLSMLGDKFLDLHPNNLNVCMPNDIVYAKKYADGTYEIVPGILCSKLFSTIPSVLQLIAAQGLNIIVDSFISTMNDFNSYKEALHQFNLIVVYLYASESTIMERERRRGNRLVGSALHWLRQFDFQPSCDISVNTDALTIAESCKFILDLVKEKSFQVFDANKNVS